MRVLVIFLASAAEWLSTFAEAHWAGYVFAPREASDAVGTGSSPDIQRVVEQRNEAERSKVISRLRRKSSTSAVTELDSDLASSRRSTSSVKQLRLGALVCSSGAVFVVFDHDDVRRVGRLLRAHGFELRRQKGSKRFYGKPGFQGLVQVDFHGKKEVPTGTPDPAAAPTRRDPHCPSAGWCCCLSDVLNQAIRFRPQPGYR